LSRVWDLRAREVGLGHDALLGDRGALIDVSLRTTTNARAIVRATKLDEASRLVRPATLESDERRPGW
jgi:hypothetical protein